MAEARVKRRLAAILAADVAGYGRLMGVDEEGTLAALKAYRRELIEPKIAEHRGRIVKTTGDGVLVEFASAVDAARCAIEVQHGMVEQNASVPPAQRIEFRIGIHVGDIIFDDNDIFGDGVNIAARLEAIAEPGGVCISDDLQRQIRGKVDSAFEDMGPQSLKNIVEPMRAWRVRLNASGSVAAPIEPPIERAQALALPDKPSIAVLPFANLSGDPEQEYFANGIVEDIITALSRVKSFFVIARNSSFTYKGKTVDVKQVARELGVRYVLEGSVRKAGNKVRITGQLIDGATGAHVWVDSFDGALENIFDLQDRITASVVAAIEPNLQLAEIGRLKQKPPASFDAYDLLLRAWQLLYEFTEESLAAAIVCLKKALVIDPNYAPAMAMTAFCFSWRRMQGWAQDATAETTEGLQLAARAVELGKDDSQVLEIAGFVVTNLAMDAQRAKELIHRSLLLNPNSATALMMAGTLETFTSNPAKGLELLRRSERLNPRDPRGSFWTYPMALAHFVEGRFDEAANLAQITLSQNSRHATALLLFAASLAKLGRRDEAAEAVRKMLKVKPRLTLSRIRARSMFYEESVWNKLAEGLRLAGLPE
jgi:adenylate cyclase